MDNTYTLVISLVRKAVNPDYVIDACDSVKTKQALMTACLYKKIKIISCMGTGNKLNPLD